MEPKTLCALLAKGFTDSMTQPDPSVNPARAFSLRTWEVWSAPRRLVVLLISVELLALIGSVQAFASFSLDTHLVTIALVIVGLSAAYEEGARRVEALRFRFAGGLNTDMSSVWIVAAALALPPPYAVAVTVAVRTCFWFLCMRKVGAKPFRQVFTGSTMVLACLSAGKLLATLGLASGNIPGSLRSLLAVLIVIGVYIAINRGLVVAAMSVATGSFSLDSLTLTWEDNALEFATLSLGGVAALVLIGNPWFIVLVLAPMFGLQRSALVKEFRQAAMTDAKTGLLNAVAWQELAQRELVRADREKVGAGVLILDLDHFKSVNEDFGHLGGDAILKAVGECLHRELREYDAVGRFGGEEFVALLPGVGELETLMVAERLRVAISAIPMPTINGVASDRTLTSSIGVSCFPEHASDLQELLRCADGALYAAKNIGRNRVQLFSFSL
jgi:diguanylate cyclase (GGDEF)-like protein